MVKLLVGYITLKHDIRIGLVPSRYFNSYIILTHGGVEILTIVFIVYWSHIYVINTFRCIELALT